MHRAWTKRFTPNIFGGSNRNKTVKYEYFRVIPSVKILIDDQVLWNFNLTIMKKKNAIKILKDANN